MWLVRFNLVQNLPLRRLLVTGQFFATLLQCSKLQPRAAALTFHLIRPVGDEAYVGEAAFEETNLDKEDISPSKYTPFL